MANRSPVKRGPSRLAGIHAQRDQEILAMSRRGRTQTDIAARLGITRSAVSQILARLRQAERNGNANDP